MRSAADTGLLGRRLALNSTGCQPHMYRQVLLFIAMRFGAAAFVSVLGLWARTLGVGRKISVGPNIVSDNATVRGFSASVWPKPITG